HRQHAGQRLRRDGHASRHERPLVSERILLIDDDESIRKVIGYMLEEAGYAAETAATAAEGLQAFRSQRPDLVLTDVKMPRKSGIELLSELKSIDPSVPVIIL